MHSQKETIGIGKKLLFSTVMGVICLLIVVLIEMALRVAGCGIDTRPFITPCCLNDSYITNTNLFRKYYPRKPLTRPDKIPDMMAANKFSREKRKTTLRGFVIGGSTAQGFPYQRNQSFSKIAESALSVSGKYETVEVLNLGLSAITSYCVKDMAAKLLRYQPDFLVIYTGHNEYYGTISNTTGGGYFSKNLYLALNESRLFQLLFNLQNILNPPTEYATLMEEQFNQKRIPLKNGIDGQVAADFIRNIDDIVKSYQQRKIPVIIIEPVSNLYDMPPFSGERDAELKDFIQAYAAVINGNDDCRELEAFYKNRMQEKKYDQNANVRYLDAVARKMLTGKTNFVDFNAAKELDTLPFRARDVLISRLRDYCFQNAKDYPDLLFIPLGEIMARNYGAEAFGDVFFIDHLHFTQKGQRLLSRILTEQIAEIFHFSKAEKEKMTDFYQEEIVLDQVIHYLPGCRTDVYRKIRSLTENLPYNRMLVPYYRKNVDGLNETNVDRQLLGLIADAEKRKMDPAVIIAAFYANHGRLRQSRNYLDTYLWTYPGNYRPYLILARYKRTFTKDVEGTYAGYKTAYLLSGKMKSIYDEIDGFLAGHNREDLLGNFRESGKPIE